MTSKTKAAETQVAPYLTHVVSHHGRLTLIPPENAGRVRSANASGSTSTKSTNPSAKKEKKVRKNLNGERERISERSGASEEQRFNLGTPRLGTSRRRTAKSTGQGRIRDQGQSDYDDGELIFFSVLCKSADDVQDINIPDYPPPSFQEATSTYALSSNPSLLIAPSVAGSFTQSSSNVSPVTEPSPIESLTPSQRGVSMTVEPSSSQPPSPSYFSPSLATLQSASRNPSVSTTCQTALYQERSVSPLTPQPQSPASGSDSGSDNSLEIVSRPEDGSSSQWEEERRRGISLKERVKRELERQRTASGIPQPQSDLLRPTSPTAQSGSSRWKSQDLLGKRKGRQRYLETPEPASPSSWRQTLDEPSLRTMSSSSALASVSSSQRALPPLAPIRPMSPSRPYRSLGPASSSLSLSLSHLKIPGAFGRSTTSLGAFSAHPSGSGSRRIFSKGKGKYKEGDKDQSFSDGDIDGIAEEALDSWEVVPTEEARGYPGPSKLSKPLRPRLTLKPHLKPAEISLTTYNEKPVEGRGARESDTRVDPFPISAQPSSPEPEEPEEPSSITPTPTNLYAPASFPNYPPSPTTTVSSSISTSEDVYEHPVPMPSARARCGSMRYQPAPPPPSVDLDTQPRRPPPRVRTDSIRSTSPYTPNSPSRPSPLSNVMSSDVGPGAKIRSKNPMPILTLTQNILPPRCKTPPPPSTLNNPNSPKAYTPTLWNERGREVEQEVGRLYGHSPGPHPFFHNSNHYPTANAQSQPTISAEYPAKARQVDYTHVPAVSSRLAISIPTNPQSPVSPISSAVPLSATPRGHHYRGRPLPMPPGATSPVAPLSVANLHAIQYQGEHCGHQGSSHSQPQVPEALLIDFDAEVEANTSESASECGDISQTDVAVNKNGDYSRSSSVSASSRRDRRAPDALGEGHRVSEPSLTTAEPRPQFSEYTDLDILLSGIQGDNQNGSDYDVSHTT